MTSTINVTDHNGVATIALNRPERHNTATPRMGRELLDAISDISTREDVNILVLTGTGKFFCPGADINAIVDGSASTDGDGSDLEIYRIPALLHSIPQLTVAAINGGCAGAGLGWACACDLRFASDNARITTAFLERGVAGDMSLPWTLPRIVGPAMARKLSFLPDILDAPEAERIGLVHTVFKADAFRAEMDAVTSRLRSYRPQALRKLKEHYLKAERSTLSDFGDHEAIYHVTHFDSSGFTAFLQR